ncbi:hypothetical protein [Ferroplasma acidarmanus]|uniref:hypothetical protein n=1 Tax=Ferroplasma acidarmanus TaxID=97393 RepID=UPI0000F5176F|nr:hypothetical protein [Ferroplasma acidarmanus]
MTRIDEEIDKLDCDSNIKNFLKDALSLEYEFRDNEKPRVTSMYNGLIEKYIDGEEDVHQ